MWTNTIDETASGFCRTLNGMAGHFPSACLVDSGRPALYLALAVATGIAALAIFAWKKMRAA